MFLAWHSAKQPFFYLLENRFAECTRGTTRQRSKLRRVPRVWHSANFGSLPSATSPALGKVPLPVPFGRPVSFFFTECGVAHGKRLPSAREKALGTADFAGRRKAVCASPSATLGKVGESGSDRLLFTSLNWWNERRWCKRNKNLTHQIRKKIEGLKRNHSLYEWSNREFRLHILLGLLVLLITC